MNTCSTLTATLLLAGASLLGAGAATYPETHTPRTLGEWKESKDGKLSVCLAVDKTTFASRETIVVRCAVRNDGDKAITILRPFGDSFYAWSSGLVILGPDGLVTYQGEMKEYVLGLGSFVELPPHSVVDETIDLPRNIFPGLGKPGLYTIRYQYMSGGYPKEPAPATYWQGLVTTASVTILLK